MTEKSLDRYRNNGPKLVPCGLMQNSQPGRKTTGAKQSMQAL